MNVALVILYADPARGGAERYTRDLAAGLAARGHAVTLAATSFADVPAGVATVPIAATGATRVGRYARFLDGVDALAGFDVVHAMLPVRRCDVYHPHAGVAAEAVAAGGWAGRLNRRRVRFAAVERALLAGVTPSPGTPGEGGGEGGFERRTILDVPDHPHPNPLPAYRERGPEGGPAKTYLTPPVVLCLSRLIRDVVRRNYPRLAEDRLVALFNGTDLVRFDPAGSRADFGADGPVGLMLAQDFARKGLAEAVAAVAALPGWTLVVGGRDEPGPYRKLAAQLGVAERVRFLGPVADAPAAYRAADLFVLPTRHDPCSLVVLEALAMGVPVISTRQNGACEVMVDGVHGRVLPSPGEGLAEAVRDVIARRGAMAAACLALRPALSQADHLDKLEGVYRAVTGRKG